MKVRIVHLTNALTRSRQIRVCLISNAANEVWTLERKRGERSSLSSVITVQIISQRWVWFHPIRPAELLDLDLSGNQVDEGDEGKKEEGKDGKTNVCVPLKQRGRQGWERADKELLFVLCCFKELSPRLTHTQTRGFPRCWACEPYRIIPQSSVNRDVGSPAIRPHIWQSIDVEKWDEGICRQLDSPADSLDKWEPDEAGKLNRLSAHSLLGHHIHSAYTISTLL